MSISLVFDPRPVSGVRGVLRGPPAALGLPPGLSELLQVEASLVLSGPVTMARVCNTLAKPKLQLHLCSKSMGVKNSVD